VPIQSDLPCVFVEIGFIQRLLARSNHEQRHPSNTDQSSVGQPARTASARHGVGWNGRAGLCFIQPAEPFSPSRPCARPGRARRVARKRES
jgi:hypothetical protein